MRNYGFLNSVTERQARFMLGWLILSFTATPVIELVLLIHIGGRIGAWNTAGIVILTGIAGALLARDQGFSALRRIEQSINRGIMPGDEMLSGIMILCGGLFFLTPGFITDLLGLLMLAPPTRSILKKHLSRKIKKMIDGNSTIVKRF